jgi:FemAB-related protein (PEP-CTERM system-associated)
MVQPFDGSDPEWDAAVERLDGGTFCHLSAWGPIFETTWGHRFHRWITRSPSGEIQGLLSAVEMKSRLFGHNLVSMPFLNYGGPLGPADHRRALAEAAITQGNHLGVKLVELRDRSAIRTGERSDADKVIVLLPLPDESEQLWSEGLKAKVRSQIRRPMKADMTAQFGLGQVGDFYRVFARNMRDLGTPVLGWELFHQILAHLGDSAILCVVRTSEGKPVAAGLGFLFGGEFEITWASSLREYSREAPNMLLYWSLMEEVIRRGGRMFNFGRSTPGSGPHRFKLQWGGEDHPLHWTRWSPHGDAAPPCKDGGLFSKAIAAWQRLPLPVANALGPRISRGLPTW